MEAVSNWKKAHNKCNGQIIWKQSSLICKREREKTLFTSPNPDKQIHMQCFCLFIVLSLLLFYTTNVPCRIRGKFLHFCPRVHGTGGSGKKWEVKIFFYRVNSEIVSVSHPTEGMKTPASHYLAHFYMYQLFSLLPPFLSAAQAVRDLNISSFLFNHCTSDDLSHVQSTCTPNCCDNTCHLDSSFIFKALHKHQLTQI